MKTLTITLGMNVQATATTHIPASTDLSQDGLVGLYKEIANNPVVFKPDWKSMQALRILDIRNDVGERLLEGFQVVEPPYDFIKSSLPDERPRHASAREFELLREMEVLIRGKTTAKWFEPVNELFLALDALRDKKDRVSSGALTLVTG